MSAADGSALAQGMSLPPAVFGPYDAAAVAAYAAISGDDNPLHSDPAVAARAGLAGMPIHGMLIMGAFEPYLAGWRADVKVSRLSAKFIGLVFVGDHFEISGKVVRVPTDGPAVLRLVVKRGGDLVCLAEAAVSL